MSGMKARAAIAAVLLLVLALGVSTAQAEARISLAKVKREARELLRLQCGDADRCVSKRLQGCQRTSRTRARCRAVYVFTDSAGTTRATVVTRWKQDGRGVEATDIDSHFEPLRAEVA